MDEADPVFICISVKEVTEQLIAAFFVLLDTMSRSGKERYIDGINERY